MTMRRVRIYAGSKDESDVIGFSASASNAPDHPAFADFMTTRGYSITETSSDQIPETSVSWRHIEVRPPLSDKDIKDFGALCVGGLIDGANVEAIVDSHNNDTVVYNNRRMLPATPLGGGITVAIG